MEITEAQAERALEWLIKQEKVWGLSVRDIREAMQAGLAGVDVSSVSTTHALCEIAAELRWRINRALQHLLDDGWKAKSFDDQRLVDILNGTVPFEAGSFAPTLEDIRLLEALREGLRMVVRMRSPSYHVNRVYAPRLLEALEKVVPP